MLRTIIFTFTGLMALVLLLSAPQEARAQSGTQKLLEAKRQQEGGTAQQPGAPAAQDTGESVVVESQGMSSYRANDPARSREEAIEAAQRDAVEQASGVIISSESQMKNFELVHDEVLTRSKGFIKRYEIIKEGIDGPFYALTIKAEVVKQAFLSDVNESLGELYRRVGMPRVMLTVDEIDMAAYKASLEANGSAASQDDTSLQVVEKEIRKILLKQGFTFIDARAVTKGSMVEKAEKGRDTSRDSLLDEARTTKAEILMIGRGKVGGKTMMSKFNVVEAQVGLDVIRTDNGQVIASEVMAGKGLHINEQTAILNSLQKAAQEITPKIMEQVTYLWIKEKQEGARLEMVVRNISFKDLVSLKRQLGSEVRGVKKVTQRSYKGGTALLELTSRDRPDKLAEALYEVEFDGFSLEVEDVTSSSLIVTFNKAKQ
ncbi:MAG: hypothetical protein OEZ59_10245 [Deltaproteobacteria bacterium]|nr:hypothetical protein [Deltaproteobacteria bacterium]